MTTASLNNVKSLTNSASNFFVDSKCLITMLSPLKRLWLFLLQKNVEQIIELLFFGLLVACHDSS